MNPEQHGVYHVEDRLLPGSFHQRIGPDCRLLRRACSRTVCRDRRHFNVIRLVGYRLDALACQHGIFHSHAAAAAVLNNQVRIRLKNLIQPVQIRPGMGKQSFTCRIRMVIGSNAGVDIIIHLDIANAVFLHQPLYNSCGIVPHLFISEIQLIPAVVDYGAAVSLKEPVLTDLGSHRTVDSHHLQFQPESRNHTFIPDISNHFPDSSRETSVAGQPLSDSIPPVPVGIPAAVNAEIPHQTVHIVVKDNWKFLVVLIFPADSAPVLRQLRDRLLKFTFCRRYRARYREKVFIRFQDFQKSIFLVRGSPGLDIKRPPDVADLPMPRSARLNLPHQGLIQFRIVIAAHGQMLHTRPASRVGDSNPFHGKRVYRIISQLI